MTQNLTQNLDYTQRFDCLPPATLAAQFRRAMSMEDACRFRLRVLCAEADAMSLAEHRCCAEHLAVRFRLAMEEADDVRLVRMAIERKLWRVADDE